MSMSVGLGLGMGGGGGGRRMGGSRLTAEKGSLDLKLIVRLLRHTRPYRLKRNLLLVTVTLRSIQLPCLAAILSWVIGTAVAEGDFRKVIWGSAAFLMLAIFTQVMFHFRRRWGDELGEAVVYDLRNQIFEHLQKMPMSFYNKMKLGRIISRMTSDVENVRIGVQEVLFVGIVQGGQGLVAAAFLIYYDWVLFLLMLTLAPVMFFINRFFHRRLSEAYRAVQESFSRVTGYLAESVNGIRVTQSFVRQDRNREKFDDLVEDHSDYHLDAARNRGLYMPALELNTQIFIAAGIILVGGYRVIEAESANIGDLVGFFIMAQLFFQPIITLAQMYDAALTAMAGAERVFGLLDTEPEWTDPPDAIEVEDIHGLVEFKNVQFEYDPGRPVLRDINFTAQPGQSIALVGATGSGKTTMISLVGKFYLPTGGTLLIDGNDIVQINSQSLHRRMGIVLQANFLFTGTIMDNIRLGRPGATDEQVIEVARRLDCLDVFGALPQGLSTSVGEGGSSLSLGQRQLVCFCRALLADPRILILDEATSSVDTMTEARVQKALAILIQGRTSFVVAHRLSTIRHADKVLVMEHGRIVEEGTHLELLGRRGLYLKLYEKFIRGGMASEGNGVPRLDPEPS
ncbi:MAG: ABC transporter ATP-binding protein [Phycisphaeraceae bacterium]|nr:ABC transporter ATP-binding protein [Phycisphaeraceae bacterium]